jgi:hypothetical protein
VLHPPHLIGIPSDAKASLLASLFLAPHTSATLQAISYLLALHRNYHTLSPLALETDNGQSFSSLHALSLIPESHMTNQSQLTSRILHLVLSIDPSTDSLGQAAPMLGTPLTAAVLLGAQEVVATLVESGWQDGRQGAESAVDVDVRLAFGRDSLWESKGEALQTTKFAPITLAQHIATERLGRLEDQKAEITWEDVKTLKRAAAIVRILEQADKPTINPRNQGSFWARNNIDARVSALEKQAAVAAGEPEIVRDTEEANLPVDLSVLTEEKPSGWQEGCEMTQEMSLRIFLRHFRAENSGFGDGIVKQMGGMFNK